MKRCQMSKIGAIYVLIHNKLYRIKDATKYYRAEDALNEIWRKRLEHWSTHHRLKLKKVAKCEHINAAKEMLMLAGDLHHSCVNFGEQDVAAHRHLVDDNEADVVEEDASLVEFLLLEGTHLLFATELHINAERRVNGGATNL